MPKLPTVAIIGRPNTGKSTLFNRIIGERKAIESPIPGTTRDHISKRINLKDVSFLLIDTGGIGNTRDKDFEEDVTEQSLIALENADLILFTVNTKEEITADDRKVVDMIRKKGKRHVPVIVLLTKADSPDKRDGVMADYHEVNVGTKILPVSASHNMGMDELMTLITAELKALHFGKVKDTRSGRAPAKVDVDVNAYDEEEEHEAVEGSDFGKSIPRVAIIGRPNVGKSSIVNALMSPDQREKSPLLVSEIAGTTRDAVDAEIRYQDKPYVLVDTAGLKKHAQNLDEIERYAMMRTITSIESCDVVILVVDAEAHISQQDKKIASIAVESGKGLIILANKIDKMKGQARVQRLEEIGILLNFCRFARIIPCSAVTREGLVKLFDVVESVQMSRTRRLSTRELRRWFEQVVHGKPLGEIARTKHITQAKEIPPTFVLFLKTPKKVSVTQLRYLENRMRETFGFGGTPIRWVTRGASDKNDTNFTVK